MSNEMLNKMSNTSSIANQTPKVDLNLDERDMNKSINKIYIFNFKINNIICFKIKNILFCLYFFLKNGLCY